MRNIVKSLFTVMACFMASTVWADVQSFTAAEIVGGTKKGTVTVSTTLSMVNKQMCKENNKAVKIDAVEGGSTANTVNDNYVQISATSDITQLYLHATYNSSGSGKKMAFVYWGDGVTPAIDNVLSAELVTFVGYDGACDQNYVTVTLPAGVRTIRIYRQLKKFDGHGAASTNYGDGTTFFIADIDVTAGSAGPSTDATLKSIVYGTDQTPVPNFSADKLNYEVELPAEYVGGAPSVQATANDSKATINYTQATTLPSTAKIDVTAEDGTTKLQYTVTFSRESAAPKVESATWDNIKGTAVIDNVNLTIKGEVKNGSSLTVAPTFTGKNISSWTPTSAQNFANGPIQYTFTSATSESTVYEVTITEEQLIPVSSVSLNKTSTSIKVGANETLTATVLPADAANKNVSWSSNKPGVATVNNGVVTGVAEGTATITVTTEDGGKTATCTVTVQEGSPVPPTKLLIHVPEVYEAKDIAGGYNTPLTVVEGREYEVYYTERTADGDYPTFATTTASEGKSNGISGSTSKTKNEGRPGDTWFEGTITEHSECKSASSEDEFVFGTKMIREHRLSYSNANTYQFHVKGFDQFSLWGMDKKLDPKNGNQVFVVKVDGEVQPMEYNAEKYTVRRFNITTKEHLIEISVTKETSSNKCAMGGFSLRVAQEPRTKYLKGNDSTQVILQTQAPKQSIYYVTKYNNIPGAETKLEWIGAKAEGIELTKLEGELTDTLVLGGTANCPVGEYKYAVVAYYNGVETSRAEGKFKVATDIKAMSVLNVEVYQNEEMDQIKFRYYALDPSAVKLTWPNNRQPAGISGKGLENNLYVIGGTPTAPEGNYPYEITVEGADTTFKGMIIVRKLDYGQNPVLYLYKNEYNDGVYDYLMSKNWNVISRKAQEDGLRPDEQYAKYKWVLISEDADANNAEVLALVRGGSSLPVLNMNAFTYTWERNPETPNGWGEPDNGSLSKEGRYITVQREDHPIFKSLQKKRGDKIQVVDTILQRGLMPINIKQQGTLCLATSPTRDIEDYFGDGEPQTILHEIPAGMRGGTKYICFPLSKKSSQRLTNDGKKLIDAVVSYLTSSETTTITIPVVQITSFSIKGIEAEVDIDQVNYTINVRIDRTKYPDLDLTAVQPVVTLASPYTSVTPASGDTVDLSTSAVLPVKYVVTDFINRCVYNVTVNTYTPEGIEEVYTAGQWVNIYDLFGRKITTTNEDIYTMELPRGIYIVITESGQTFKIAR